jgi:hypothetical protein
MADDNDDEQDNEGSQRPSRPELTFPPGTLRRINRRATPTSPIRPHAPRAREPSDVFMDEQGATGAEDGSGGKSAARSGSDFNV